MSQLTEARSKARQALATSDDRPQTEPWEDGVTVLLAIATLFAVFWDGWLHNNSTTLDSFFTSAHLAMYAGLTVLGGWIGIVFVKRQPRGKLNLSMSAVPFGYGLALVALPLAALGGPGDFAWHAAYGFENQVDAPFSPTHQMLFLAGALLGGIGLASTWHRPGRVHTLQAIWPAVLSITAVVAMIEFSFMNLLPYFWTRVPTSDFQADLKSSKFTDAYAPGTHAHHAQGLNDAYQNYSDSAFPYYLFGNMQVIAGMIIFSAVFVGAVLYLRRRWVLPFGTVTLMLTLLGVLFPFFSRFTHPEFIVQMIVSGLVIDTLRHYLIGRSHTKTWRLRFFALLIPIAIWGPYMLTIAITDGLGWNVTMAAGMLSTTAGVGYAISLVMYPPALPAVPQEGLA
jgi:hypothetical protein